MLIRHGQSAYNYDNRFTGTADCPLSPVGRVEAAQVGRELQRLRIQLDQVYCSALQRTRETFSIIAKTVSPLYDHTAVQSVPALNERNYGLLQGRNKEQAVEQYGSATVERWRRSYTSIPPGGESLEQTGKRVIQFYTTCVQPDLQAGCRILLLAHGNTLRSLIMYLEGLSPEQVEQLEVVTGEVIIYKMDAALHVLDKTIFHPVQI
ncbi:2,3-bisphosphoglycerate-dependent phosphoglycerate mutase [Mucilaginibacter robiniae]|uniref:2,3-bisphosphoglycerate-dependent phosphoglycerate mutase n=1 Tax=Mucilaginibacter robiniae TaxID=2728022 RepID=UPI001B7D15EF|nr:2,3-bisphosphoglycerate-dependent phosphoglycerate mutase [Mucilaginibacter robiniae]